MRILIPALLLSLLMLAPTASADGGNILTLESTAYEETGSTMANGEYPYFGAVACNILPLGTRIKVLDGPFAGQTFVVKDRIGWGSQLDFYLGDVAACYEYGRRVVRIVVLPEGPDIPALLDEHAARVGGEAWKIIHMARSVR